MDVLRTFKYAFGIPGVITLGIAIALTGREVRFSRESAHAVGTVVDFQISREQDSSGYYRMPLFAAVVEFPGPDGVRRFVDEVRRSDRTYHVGQRVDVLYLPGKSQRARIDSVFARWFHELLWGGLGLVFGGVGFGLAIADLHRHRVRRWLRDHGLHVQATYLGTFLDTSIADGGINPWRLKCQWQHPTTGKVYLMHSDCIWFDPSSYVKGDTLHVVVDPDNPRRYRVDVDFLPERG